MDKKYKETKISDIKDNTYLCAIKDVVVNILYLEDYLYILDDGKWNYEMNKVINPFRNELEDLASINIKENKNDYFGDLSLERLMQEFQEIYFTIAFTSPLSEEESKFVIAYNFFR